jgi:ABC-2 type transport system permease protein
VNARRFFGRVLAISAKEVRHIARDPRVVALALGLPLLMLVLFGYGITFDLERIDVVVADADRTPASRRLVDAFRGTNLFAVRASVDDPGEIEAFFRRGDARVGLVIERGFQRDLKRGTRGRAQLLIEGSDNTTGQLAVGYAGGVAQSESQRLLAEAGLRGEPPIQGKVQVRFNPGMKSARFIVPGVIAMVLATLATLLTSIAIAREWEHGSMEQLFATPVGRSEIVAGKLLPYLGMGMIQVLLLLALGTWLFDVPVLGSLWLLGGASLLFLASMLAQGLLISVITKNQQVATQVAAISTLLPAMLLSGFMFPIENMPPFLQGLSAIVPARYFIDVLRSLLLKGGGLPEIWHDLVALGAIAAVMTILAIAGFQRRIA